jgi:poly-beta-1,6-N-acetyl-D-glucosamine synthase
MVLMIGRPRERARNGDPVMAVGAGLPLLLDMQFQRGRHHAGSAPPHGRHPAAAGGPSSTANRPSQLAGLAALQATARGELPPGLRERQPKHAEDQQTRYEEPRSRRKGPLAPGDRPAQERGRRGRQGSAPGHDGNGYHDDDGGHRRPAYQGPAYRDAGFGHPVVDEFGSYAPALAFVATVERHRQDLRSVRNSTALSPGGAAGTRRRTDSVAVLIPAHNEEARISDAILSLRRQERKPDRIIVVCDNCTDRTEDIAFMEGAEIIVTEGNKGRKAGALNQALYHVLPELREHDYVLAMDADSSLNHGWIASAIEILDLDPKVGAVCGTFMGEPGGGLVGQIQRNEYHRYARIIQRRRQALVLSGTGTMFRVSVLREIAAERGRTLPGKHRRYYNPASITEDDEITLAVKTLGWKCLSPADCRTITEVMPTWQALWTQRMRWQVGTLRDLRSYGMTRVTRSYWARQVGLYGGFSLSFACLAIMILALVRAPALNEVWTAGILSVTLAERTWTARRAGLWGVLLASAILPEALYSLFQGCVFFAAFRASTQRREVKWGHV